MAPGVGPAQSAWHDMGSVQPLDESLSVADADSHSLNKRKIGARHGLNLGRSRMRERRKSGSVRGAGSNPRPYSTQIIAALVDHVVTAPGNPRSHERHIRVTMRGGSVPTAKT
jgi:hypothetical protein